MYMTLLIC